MIGHCRDCRHWVRPADKYDGGFGGCNGIPHDDQSTLAYHVDYENYNSFLRTKPEFGCVLFEKKPNAPTDESTTRTRNTLSNTRSKR